jgi:hyaluronoglucosaminidase
MRHWRLGSVLCLTALLLDSCQSQASPTLNQSQSTESIQLPAQPPAQPPASMALASSPAITPQSVQSDGVIEGFYGKPWTVTDTQTVISFLGQHGMNTFVYAPKDDLYQRTRWRQPYPAVQVAQLRKLEQTARSSHVQLVLNLSPGGDIQYSKASDVTALTRKINQLRSIGVTTLLLSFDDIPKKLSTKDNRVYHGNLALAQAVLANHVLAYEQSRDANFHLIFVPTVYSGVASNPYWTTLSRQLNPTIPVVWTGPGVLSAQITAKEVKRVKTELGHPLVIWDNYPVNDFTYVQTKHPQLFLGPVKGRDRAVPELVSGYWFNPMLQARASELPLWTAADYLRSPQTYQPDASWKRALKSLGGSATPALQLLASDASSYGEQVPPPSPAYLTSDIARYWRQPGSQNAGTTLNEDFLQMAGVYSKLQAGLPDRRLWAEIAPFAEVLSEEGQMGQLALQLEYKRKKHQSVAALRTKLVRMYKQRQANSKIVAGTAVEGFVRRILEQSS